MSSPSLKDLLDTRVFDWQVQRHENNIDSAHQFIQLLADTAFPAQKEILEEAFNQGKNGAVLVNMWEQTLIGKESDRGRKRSREDQATMEHTLEGKEDTLTGEIRNLEQRLRAKL